MKQSRPPIVTVLGHVDHGKTTLLDTIRKTRVAMRESGGITQSIGASVAEHKGKKITFIDTPGHAAFSRMRQRGVKVADMVVLVVAADDGPMPQTKEAIQFIKESQIPFLVAVTKTDLPGANVEFVKGQLEKEGVFLEGRGGDTPVVEVSAKLGKGIDELLEMISLMAEMDETKDTKKGLEAVIIETAKEKRGVTVSLVVRSGILKTGEEVYCEGKKTKIRGLFDYQGKSVKEILPGYPALVLGFSELPSVGSVVTAIEEMMIAKKGTNVASGKKIEDGDIVIIVKAPNQGVLEAILSGIPEKIHVVSSLGDITENDIFVAKAMSAKIFLFDSKVSSGIKTLSDAEGVVIEQFDVIYELFKRLQELVSEVEEKVLAKAEIVKQFPLKEGKFIAGARILLGEIHKNNKLYLERDQKRLGEVKIISLRKAKEEVSKVSGGEEFGIYFIPQFDFQPKDLLLYTSKL